MIDSYFALNGAEIQNAARTAAYIDAGFTTGSTEYGDCGCADLGDLLEQTYTTPLVDEAPWIDHRHPESYDFAGLLPMGISGGDDGVITRTTIQTTAGARLAKAVCGPRRVTFRSVLVGATCCAVDYGLRWLRNVLLGSQSGDCGGDTMELLDCCPDCDRIPGFVAANCSGGSTLTRTQQACECRQSHIKCYKDAALESGPTVVEQIGTGCGSCGLSCNIIVVEWTMISARPFAYGTREVLFENRLLPQPTDACNPVWSKDDPVVDCDTIIEDCDDGEVCEELEIPCGFIPPPPVPTDTLASCICTNPVGQVAECITIGTGEFADIRIPEFGTFVPIINISAGSAELRNVTVRFYADPLDQGCDDLLSTSGRLAETCSACATLHITAIPAGSALEVDGEDEVTRLLCRGGVREPADQVLHGSGGGPFQLPVLSQDNYVMIITADERFVSADSNWSVTLVERTI